MEPLTYLDYALMVVGRIGLMVLGAWLILKAYDALRAWPYNRKQAKQRRAVNEAFHKGQQSVMGPYAAYTYRVVTPDRPRDPWMKMVKDDIEEIFEELEGRE